jgi:plastocyanin domain-containing protein
MTGTEWLVVAGGAAAIAWINWYFFLAERSTAAVAASVAVAGGVGSAGAAGAVPEVTITVDGGYSPAALRVKAGQPVRLVFDRRDSGSCSEEVVFADFGLRKFLPTGQKTTIEITPPAAGKYTFTCGMSMLRGTLVAED